MKYRSTIKRFFLLTFFLLVCGYASGNDSFTTLQSVRFTLRFPPGHEALAEQLLRDAESFSRHMSGVLGFDPRHVTDIVLYPDRSSFLSNRVTDADLDERIAAFAFPRSRLIMMPVTESARENRASLRHEIIHCMIHDIINRGNWFVLRKLPDWFEEGICEYFSGTDTAIDRMVLRSAQRNGTLKNPDSPVVAQYVLGRARVECLAARRGQGALRTLIDRFAAGEAFDAVFADIAGSDFDTYFYDEWLPRWLGVEPVAGEAVADEQGRIHAYAFSQNGTSAVLRDDDDVVCIELRSAGGGLRVIRPDIAGRTVLPLAGNRVSLSPDGARLIYACMRDGNHALAISTEQGTRYIPYPFPVLRPYCDGENVFFTSMVAGRGLIIRYGISDGITTTLYSRPASIVECAMVAGRLYFTADEPAGGLFVVEGTRARLVVPGRVYSLSASVDGLLFSAPYAGVPAVFRLGSDGTPVLLAAPASGALHPVSNGAQILFLTYRNDGLVLDSSPARQERVDYRSEEAVEAPAEYSGRIIPSGQLVTPYGFLGAGLAYTEEFTEATGFLDVRGLRHSFSLAGSALGDNAGGYGSAAGAEYVFHTARQRWSLLAGMDALGLPSWIRPDTPFSRDRYGFPDAMLSADAHVPLVGNLHGRPSVSVDWIDFSGEPLYSAELALSFKAAQSVSWLCADWFTLSAAAAMHGRRGELFSTSRVECALVLGPSPLLLRLSGRVGMTTSDEYPLSSRPGESAFRTMDAVTGGWVGAGEGLLGVDVLNLMGLGEGMDIGIRLAGVGAGTRFGDIVDSGIGEVGPAIRTSSELMELSLDVVQRLPYRTKGEWNCSFAAALRI